MGQDENKNSFSGSDTPMNPGVFAGPATNPNADQLTDQTANPGMTQPTAQLINQPTETAPTPPSLTPNPRATFTSGNRLGMHPSRNLSAIEELNRISTPTTPAQNGDIILNGSQKKPQSKKKIFVVLGIIAVFTFIICGGIVFMLNQQKKTTTTAGTIDYKSLVSIKADLKNYASFLQTGKTGETYNKDLATSSWYFPSIVKNGDDTAENRFSYATNLAEQHSKILKSVSSLEDSDTKTKIKDSLEKQSKELFIVTEYMKNELITTDITNIYLTSGLVKATDKMNEYNALIDAPSKTSEWYNKIVESRKLNLDLVDNLNKIGCIKNKVIDQVCVSKIYYNTAVYSDYLKIENSLNEVNMRWKDYASSIAISTISNSTKGIVDILETIE